jgi:hypothetical protein
MRAGMLHGRKYNIARPSLQPKNIIFETEKSDEGYDNSG